MFDEHIIIFSDKHCAYPDTGDLQVDWDRWYRKAIAKSAEQIFGAERWIEDHPDRLFLDRECAQPFPLALPDPSVAKVHRIVVAHGVAERCRQELGGSGSLRIAPDEVEMPFVVGQVDPAKGFVHVLDDASLDIVLRELDTISDFVRYLSKKERLILDGLLESAAGEEDLLAQYLFPIEGKDKSGLLLPPSLGRLTIPEGLWNDFDRDPYRLARKEANAISYSWDRLIGESSRHIIANSQYFATHPGIRGGAEALRIPAREP